MEEQGGGEETPIFPEARDRREGLKNEISASLGEKSISGVVQLTRGYSKWQRIKANM